MSISTRNVSPLRVAAAWILVATPLGWGVYQSAVKSLPLFQTTVVRSSGTSEAKNLSR
jgi:hypothetical protein